MLGLWCGLVWLCFDCLGLISKVLCLLVLWMIEREMIS